jgi:hypothetical protein
MATLLTDQDWNTLLERIQKGDCAPFLGAGASYGALPLGFQLAQELAKQHHYPFADDGDLTRVAQYLAVSQDPLFPKEQVLRRFVKAAPPNFDEPDEPHGVLARLPLPVYLTSNYDNFMYQALAARRARDPRRDFCRWNDTLKALPDPPSVFAADDGYRPTAANPVVFHLHGYIPLGDREPALPESLVLTEDDYLEFLAGMAREPNLLPEPVRRALATSTLLFIGYRVADWNFRVLFQMLRPYARRRSFVVLKPPAGPDEARQKEQEYFDKYYAALQLRVFWGTARDFCGELRRRWEAFAGAD